MLSAPGAVAVADPSEKELLQKASIEASRDPVRQHRRRARDPRPAAREVWRFRPRAARRAALAAARTVVPIRYGFDRRFAFGSLHDRPFSALAPDWIANRYGKLRRVCRRVFGAHTSGDGMPFFNWHQALAVEAARVAVRAHDVG